MTQGQNKKNQGPSIDSHNTKEYENTRERHRQKYTDPQKAIEFIQKSIQQAENKSEQEGNYSDNLSQILLEHFPDFTEIIKFAPQVKNNRLSIELIQMIGSIDYSQTNNFPSSITNLFFEQKDFLFHEKLILILNQKGNNLEPQILYTFIMNLCLNSYEHADTILNFLDENAWRLWDQKRHKQLKAQIKEIKNTTDTGKLRFFDVYPDDDSIKQQIHCENKFQNGYSENKELYQTIINLEKENFVCPLRKQLAKIGSKNFDDRDLFLYQGELYPYSIKDLSLFEDTTGFIKFKPISYNNSKKFKIDWDNEERLRNGSILLFSRNNKCSHIDAICISTVPSFTKSDLSKTVINLLKDGICPVRQVSGRLVPEIIYYIFEPTEIFRVSEIRMKGIKTLNKTSFISLQPQIVKHNFTQKRSQDINNIMYDYKVLEKATYGDHVMKKATDNMYDSCEPEWINQSLRVDSEQYAAIKHFINYPLTLVNGYPGTGKTHLAIEAVRLLLNSTLSTPIVVVTQTNHSLDAFLENLIVKGNVDPEKILRHGGKFRTENKSVRARNLTKDMMREYYPKSGFFKEKEFRKDSCYKINMYNYLLCEIYRLAQKVDEYRKSKKGELFHQIIEGIYEFVLPMAPNFRFYEIYGFPFNQNEIQKISKKPDPKEYIYFWLAGWEAYKKKMNDLSKEYKIDIMNDMSPDIVIEDYDPDKYTDKDRDNRGAGLSVMTEYAKIREFRQTSWNINARKGKRDYKEENDDDNDINVDDDTDKNVAEISRELISNEEIRKVFRDNDIEHLILDAIKKSVHNENRIFDELLNLLQLILTVVTSKRDNKIANLDSNKPSFDREQNFALSLLYKKHKVIGLTASYASMFKSALDQCGCQFMIIEEAGELTEATTISLLPNSLTHLMMIGDYQQLRPKVEYELRETKNPKYAYDISTFERLVRAEKTKQKQDQKPYDLFLLTAQRRMHPQISSIIREFFCPELIDKAPEYDNIDGLSSHLNFILSDFTEGDMKNSRSKINLDEAEYAVALVFFFLYRGVEPKNISIVALYKGQTRNIRALLDKTYRDKKNNGDFENYDPLRDDDISEITVQCMDNYQGEENDVIIVATTRSEAIGFIAEENRHLVSLSRAKRHLVVLGNSTLLKEEKAENWPKIIDYVKEKYPDCISEGIKIKCEHSQRTILLKTPRLLWKHIFGNCEAVKLVDLPCGHKGKIGCGMKKPMLCTEKCSHKCKNEHQCTGICWLCQKKGHPPCTVKVPFTCEYNHNTKVMCFEQVNNTAKCRHKCEKLLRCGHKCALECCHIQKSEPCDCRVKIPIECEECGTEQTYFCGHEFHCQAPCKKILYCGHQCEMKCSERCKCTKACKYVFPCGHKCDKKCNNENDNEHQHLHCPSCSEHENKTEQNDYSCGECGNFCDNNSQTPSCGHQCDKKCKICKAQCRGKVGDPCIIGCKHYDQIPVILKGTLFKSNICGCIMTMEEAEQSIKEQCNMMMDPSTENPEQIHLIMCPKCHSMPITNSWTFMYEINSANKLVKERNLLIDELEKNIKTTKGRNEQNDVVIHEEFRHNYKFVHCSCGQINCFDASPTVVKPMKCTNCKKIYQFVEKQEEKQPQPQPNANEEQIEEKAQSITIERPLSNTLSIERPKRGAPDPTMIIHSSSPKSAQPKLDTQPIQEPIYKPKQNQNEDNQSNDKQQNQNKKKKNQNKEKQQNPSNGPKQISPETKNEQRKDNQGKGSDSNKSGRQNKNSNKKQTEQKSDEFLPPSPKPSSSQQQNDQIQEQQPEEKPKIQQQKPSSDQDMLRQICSFICSNSENVPNVNKIIGGLVRRDRDSIDEAIGIIYTSNEDHYTFIDYLNSDEYLNQSKAKTATSPNESPTPSEIKQKKNKNQNRNQQQNANQQPKKNKKKDDKNKFKEYKPNRKPEE